MIPDEIFYKPLFSPWIGFDNFGKIHPITNGRTLVSPDRCWILYSLCLQALSLDGEIWECGVYKGGTAAMLTKIINDNASDKIIRLFDTFEGMPNTDNQKDWHKKGDFSDTSLEFVSNYINTYGKVNYHQGFIPDTFVGLDDTKISFAHIDVDIWQSITDCCKFIYPRLVVGGFMIFDDYGFPSCPGARSAVDSFFANTGIVPLVLPTGQAIVFKSK